MIHQQISQCVTHFAVVTSQSLNLTSGCDKEMQVKRSSLFALTSASTSTAAAWFVANAWQLLRNHSWCLFSRGETWDTIERWQLCKLETTKSVEIAPLVSLRFDTSSFKSHRGGREWFCLHSWYQPRFVCNSVTLWVQLITLCCLLLQQIHKQWKWTPHFKKWLEPRLKFQQSLAVPCASHHLSWRLQLQRRFDKENEQS